LYTNSPGNLFAQIALISADLAGVSVQVELIDKESEDYKKDFAKKHLTGKFPLIELDSGEIIFESVAIAHHFGRSAGLTGATTFQQAQVNQWIAFLQNDLLPAMGPIYYGVFGHAIVDQKAFNEALKVLKSKLKVLDTHLNGKNFMVGESLTVADVFATVMLSIGFQTVLDAGFRKAMPNLSQYF
jgi:elongation factor 1-gamma